MMRFKSVNSRVDVTSKRPINDLPRLKRGMHSAMYCAGRSHVLKLRRSLGQGTRSGNPYNFRGRRIIASAPGEFPALRSGDLLKSTAYKVHSHNEFEFGDQVFYGRFLEEGTKKMSPRPHLLPIVADEEKNTDNYLLTETDRALKS